MVSTILLHCIEPQHCNVHIPLFILIFIMYFIHCHVIHHPSQQQFFRLLLLQQHNPSSQLRLRNHCHMYSIWHVLNHIKPLHIDHLLNYVVLYVATADCHHKLSNLSISSKSNNVYCVVYSRYRNSGASWVTYLRVVVVVYSRRILMSQRMLYEHYLDRKMHCLWCCLV